MSDLAQAAAAIWHKQKRDPKVRRCLRKDAAECDDEWVNEDFVIIADEGHDQSAIFWMCCDQEFWPDFVSCRIFALAHWAVARSDSKQRPPGLRWGAGGV